MYNAQPLEAHIWQIAIDDGMGVNSLLEEDPGPILDALMKASDDPDARVVILRGRSDVFLSGANAAALKTYFGAPGARNRSIINHLNLAKVADFTLPVIGALEGHAVGGGLALALVACDITIAAERSRYGMNFASMGFTPGMASTSVVEMLVGHTFANEMLLTAKRYLGSELKDRNLFTHVVPKEAVFPQALDLARRIADVPRRTLELLKGTLAQRRRAVVLDARVQEDLMHRLTLDDPQLFKNIEESFVGSTDGFKKGS